MNISSTALLGITHYPTPVVRNGEIEWRIKGPVEASQPGLTCYDLVEAAQLCQHLNDEYFNAALEGN